MARLGARRIGVPHMQPSSALTALECARCGHSFNPDQVCQTCSCGSPLLARYDLAAVRKTFTREALRARPPDLWRYRELLPVRRDDSIISLGERITPLVKLKRVGQALGLRYLSLKDEGVAPTGSFKARGAAVGISRARELGVRTFALPSNGNAGSAWALYAARAGMTAYVVLPVLAPAIHRLQCVLAGARVSVVDGLIGDAGRVVGRAVARSGMYDASTLKEPYRIEGKKTLGFEIAEQFDWELPDVIVYPTGGGVGLIGMHKAFEELHAAGLITGRLPRFVAVQAAGCAPIVEAWRERKTESRAWKNAGTIAFGINVPKALGDFLILRALYKSGGCAIQVDDHEILEYQHMLIAQEGVLACPEGGATLAAVATLHKEGALRADERVLIINTGSGALYPDVPYPAITMIGPDDDLALAADY